MAFVVVYYKMFLSAKIRQVVKYTHVARRLPLPRKNGTKIRVHSFETLYPYENKMSIKKISSMDKKVTS